MNRLHQPLEPRTRKLRSVSTSDVPSTSAPLTTCAVLITGSLPLQTTNAPSVTCIDEEQQQQERRADQLAAAAMVIEHVAGRREDRERDDQRADPVREMNRDPRVPHRRNQVAEREREIGNRQPRVGVPHRRADEDLRVDESVVVARDAPQHRVVDRRGGVLPAAAT